MTSIDRCGRLPGRLRHRPPSCSKKWYEPAPPPEKLFDCQPGVVEGGGELLRLVAPAVALNLIEFREKLGQRRHTYDQDSTWPDELAEVHQGGSIVVEMFDDVEGQYRVEYRVGGSVRTKGSREICLDERPIWSIQSLKCSPGDIEPTRSISPLFERIEGNAPTAARVQNTGRRVDRAAFQDRHHQPCSCTPPGVAVYQGRQLGKNGFRHECIRLAARPGRDHGSSHEGTETCSDLDRSSGSAEP